MFAFALICISACLIFGFNNVLTIAMSGFIIHIGGDTIDAGFQTALFISMAIVIRFCFAPFVDRIGAKRLMMLGIAAFCVPTPAFLLCDSLWQIMVLRCVQAIGLAAYMPSSSTLTTLVSAPDQIGRNVGILRISALTSLLFGPSLCFPLIDRFGYDVFFIVMTLIAVVGCLVLVPVRFSEPCMRQDEPFDVSWQASDKSALHRTVPLLAIQFLVALAYSSVFVFGQLMMELRFPDSNSGLFFSAISVGGIFAGIVLGKLLDTCGIRLANSLALLACVIGFTLLGTGLSLIPLVVSAFLCGLGYYGCSITTVSALGKTIAASKRGFAVSMQQNSLDSGLASGSLLFGVVPVIGEGSKSVFMCVALVLCTVLVLWIIGWMRNGWRAHGSS
jgi:MFS family permease